MIYDAEAKTNNVNRKYKYRTEWCRKETPCNFSYLYDRNNETINLFSVTFRFNIKEISLNFSVQHSVSTENYNFEEGNFFRNQL